MRMKKRVFTVDVEGVRRRRWKDSAVLVEQRCFSIEELETLTKDKSDWKTGVCEGCDAEYISGN